MKAKWRLVWLTCVAAFVTWNNGLWFKNVTHHFIHSLNKSCLNEHRCSFTECMVGGLCLVTCTRTLGEMQGEKRRESTSCGGLSLYSHSLVQEANTSWHPWNPFLICWLKVMGRERKWGRKGEKRKYCRSEFSVYKISSSLKMILLGFFSDCCWHVLWSCREGHSAVMSVQILFFKADIIYCKVGAHITYHKPC